MLWIFKLEIEYGQTGASLLLDLWLNYLGTDMLYYVRATCHQCSFQRVTLATTGYGKHKVASFYNGMLGRAEDGTHRFVCECIR